MHSNATKISVNETENPMTLDEKKSTAAAWFRQLRDQICTEFEAIENELTGSDKPAGTFTRTVSTRTTGRGQTGHAGAGATTAAGGGGRRPPRKYERPSVTTGFTAVFFVIGTSS